MKIQCVWEHNGNDSLLYACNVPGAFARGESLEAALAKMPAEITAFLRWKDEKALESPEIAVVQEKSSELEICDADSDVLFDSEKGPLSREQYDALKALALRSAADFLALYEAIPDKRRSALPPRRTFYGDVPRTAEEMYLHTKNVNSYYWGEIGVEADNKGTILECRLRGFEALEARPDFLGNRVYSGSYGEEWSLAKVLRRFLWHDRIHAKAMYRMGRAVFGRRAVPDVFRFEG